MIAVEVEDEGWLTVAAVEDVVSQAAEGALSAPPGRSGDVAVLLADDEAVCELNARFRGRSAPTNVLSFPAPASARPHLGDVALAHGVCTREAAAQGKRLADHLSHLVVHGVLHLIGYDHATDADAQVMETMERDILGRLGIADPYLHDMADAGP